MDKNSDPHVSKENSPEENNHGLDAEKKNKQKSRDELSNFTRPDEPSNVDSLSKIQSAIPENLDESASLVKSDSAEIASYIPRLSIGEQSPASTSELEQKNNFNDLSKRQQSKGKYENSTIHLPPEKQSTDVSEKHKTTVEAMYNKNCFLSKEQVNNKLIEESGSSATDVTPFLPEEEEHRHCLLRTDENHTNFVHASEKDLKSPCPTQFSEISKLHKFSQTDLDESTRQNAIDIKRFSDRGCQTDDIKFLDSECQTDPINSLEHEKEVDFEKFSENKTCVTACSTRNSGTLKESEGEPYASDSSIYKSDTSKHSECESSTTGCFGCDSYSADISESQSDDTEESSESQTDGEPFSDSQKNSELSDSQTDVSENSYSPADVSENSYSRTDISENSSSPADVSENSSNRPDVSELSDIRTDTSELSDIYSDRSDVTGIWEEIVLLSNYSTDNPEFSDIPADSSDRSNDQTDISEASDNLTDVTELSESSDNSSVPS